MVLHNRQLGIRCTWARGQGLVVAIEGLLVRVGAERETGMGAHEAG